MKNLLRKLHIGGGGSNHSDDSDGSTTSSSKGRRFSDVSPSGDQRLSQSKSEHNKPFSSISGWLNSVANRHNPSHSNAATRMETSDSGGSCSLESALDAVRRDSGASVSRDHEIEEEYQIRLALELSAKEDPEAAQIEAVKQISLGTCIPENTPAEVLAYRYWNYNALGYDDKILDGFYDLYDVLSKPTSSRMPSLVDLQETPVSNDITWEAVLVNKASDTKLLSLEQRILEMAYKARSYTGNFATHDIVYKLAVCVSDQMGGPVIDPENMLITWRNHHRTLKASHSSMIMPLGSLTIGLARHRALLFKVLADSLEIPCRLVKGQQFTGSDDVAMNFVKVDDGREYIVDLMADPGTLIPSDAVGADVVHEDSDISQLVYSSIGTTSSLDTPKDKEPLDKDEYISSGAVAHQPIRIHEGSRNSINDSGKKPLDHKKNRTRDLFSGRPAYASHARSPSWTEGVSSPAVQRMKVKDVSQYMIDAAKENPQLAQKLHDVLLESGVVAPHNLFTGMLGESKHSIPEKEDKDKKDDRQKAKVHQNDLGRSCLPPLPHQGLYSRDCTMDKHPPQHSRLDLKEVSENECSSDSVKYVKNVPVAEAAVAAAVVASSMVVAVAKANHDPKLHLPVATAAALVVTSAAVSKQYEGLTESSASHSPDIHEQRSGDREHDGVGTTSEGERISDKSTGNESSKSDVTLDEVADCEIAWEDIALGERIGLGSYGEVYRGDWHGTEVAVKKFLDQDITGESLEEFKSEVKIMKKLRHPNVVLFMGAVTRPPNLSIVTEFLPRGSLYRLLHRPNNQLDERRRLRMALDAARGMNYLHNCTPVIVHRDLKSPNLLVDKNWVVKVCDFGLSRMKHSTFLSSRSTAGTAEWMAPEVLRNEPSNEKCDVYSFGVILWELCTLQQPWGGMNPMQVVGAVGFQHRRLEIPDYVDPVIADIITRCWQTDPNLRPAFTEIMAALKPLQKPITHSQVPKPGVSMGRRSEKDHLEADDHKSQ